MNRLQKYYINIIYYDLLFKDHYINIMQLPQINKITLNIGLGLKAILDKKQILTALLSLELITNQKPIITKAKKSIDKFKLRENMPIGCKVTLRKYNLYKFIDCLINIVIPIMDNSTKLFSSIYFKEYTIKQNKLLNIYNLTLLKNILLNKNILKIENILNKIKNNEIKIYWKWILNKNYINFINLKLWSIKSSINNFIFLKKKIFIPKGINYIYYNFNKFEENYINQHIFNINSNYLLNYSNKSFIYNKNKNILFKKKQLLNFNYYNIAFGFKDFISSFGTIFNYGQLLSTHGVDIIIIIRYLKNNNLKQPDYFLSSYQLPF